MVTTVRGPLKVVLGEDSDKITTTVNKVIVQLVQTVVHSHQMVISVSLLKQTNNKYIHFSSILIKTT